MTIDEIITVERDNAEFSKLNNYDKSADYHNQIAELLEELKSYRTSVFSGDMTQKMLKEEYNKAIDDAIKIVKENYRMEALEKLENIKACVNKIVQEVEEEFATDTNVGTNGWIPCSDWLPEECTEVLVSVKEIDGSFYTRTSWVQDGVWVIKKTPLQPTVIAWQTLPEPYKESED